MGRRNTKAPFGLAAMVMAFSLFDNYISPPGIRPFDFVGWALMFVAFLLGWLRVRFMQSSYGIIKVMLVGLVFLPAVLLGIVVQHSWSTLPFVLGVSTFLVLVRSDLLAENIEQVLKYLLLVVSSALILQFLLLLGTGEVKSFLFLITEEGTRSNFGGLLYRPTGLYIEPGSHAFVSMTLMCAYSSLTKRKDWVVGLAACSIVLSLSLAGVLALLVFFVLPTTWRVFETRYVIGVATFILLLIPLYSALSQNEKFNLAVVSRIEGVQSGLDGSVQHRFRLGSPECHEFLIEQAHLFPVIGSGLSSDAFVADCGSNNIAWMLYSMGYLGAVLLVSISFYSVRHMPLVMFGLVYVLLSGQISSYPYIWMYLAMVTIISRQFYRRGIAYHKPRTVMTQWLATNLRHTGPRLA